MGRATGALPAAVDGNRQLSELYARDAVSVAGLQKLRFFPQAVIGGKGAVLRTDDGRTLIDLSAAWGAASLG
jgi:4-aminobutyrate aminotransferase